MARTTRTKKPQTPAKCDKCDKVYCNAQGLRRHMHDHDPTYYFYCPEPGCDRKSKQAHAIKIHRYVHKPEVKPWACPLCPKRFSDPSSLTRHQYTSIHRKGPKPFPCTQEGCQKSYSRKEGLRTHMRKEHDKDYTAVFGNAKTPRRQVMVEAYAEAERLQRAVPSGSKSRPAKKTKRVQDVQDTYNAPPPEFQLTVKPETERLDAQYVGIDFGTPQQAHHYAQDLAPLPVPPQHATFDMAGTATPWHRPHEIPRLEIPIHQYGYAVSDMRWDGAPRHYAPSPDGSSARQSPLMTPNMAALHSMAPSPARHPLDFQAHDPPAYQKVVYAAHGQSMWAQEQQYPAVPNGAYLEKLQFDPAPAQPEWDAYFDLAQYGA